MTPQIKNRIEQIQRGEIPDGYKQTQVGVVPCAWEETRLDSILEFKNGINAEKEKYGKGIKMISVLDILSSKPITYNSILDSIDIDGTTLEKYDVTYGDILFQRSSEIFEDAGKSNVYLDSVHTASYGGFVIRGKKISDYNPVYLNETLKADYARKQIIRGSAGSQHINVGQNSLSKVILYLANELEQNRIAEILSTQDKVITLQEKLIQEKEEQKKYLMQILLTGKKRLKGFSGKWEEKKLGNIAKISTGAKNNQDKVANGSYPFFVRSQQVERIDSFSFDGEAILVPGEGGIGTIVHYINGKFDYHQRVYKISNFVFSSGLYIYYSFLLFFKKHSEANSVKATVDSLRLPTFNNFLIHFPPLPEQEAIAEILSIADAEIELLKKRLEQEKQKKKSIMQLLLTGIVRV